ncbi:MAG: efflux RND transporter periplasmic adaptor subunit [Spirochaetota bacterium]|nr:efflux RND transporter periplasmic adaptor subunit [Spirochaetota bacterium]
MVQEETRRLMLRRLLFSVIIVGFIGGLGIIYYYAVYQGGTKKGTLSLHGWIEGTEVSLSSKIAGEVIKLDVDEGTEVKSGDLIAQIGSEQLKSRLANVEAQVEQARGTAEKAHDYVEILNSTLKSAKIGLGLAKDKSEAGIKQAEANLASTKVLLEQTEINYTRAEKEYHRFKPLAENKSISQSKMDAVEEAYKLAQAQVERAKSGVLLADASLTMAKTSRTEVQLRQNDLRTLQKKIEAAITDENIARRAIDSALAMKGEIEATLDDTFIHSPMNGTVTEKVVELGENVAPGTTLVVLTDLSQLYVKTYIEQVDIGKVKLNDSCEIKVDSFPDRPFKGRVIFVGSRAEFTPRDVQMNDHRSSMVYKIKVGIDNPTGVLKPGMPADIKVMWEIEKS